MIWGDQLLAILAEPVLKALPGATIIADVKASQALFDRVAELGGKPLMWKTGHSLIKSKMKETGAPLAGEMSGHIFFEHGYYGFDDALYAAVRLIGAVARRGESLTALRTRCRRWPRPSCASRSTRAASSRSSTRCCDRLAAEGAKVDRTDGARVSTGDGWWLLRASNTQDVLVARAEAKDQAGLDRLVAQIDEQLALSGVERDRGGALTGNPHDRGPVNHRAMSISRSSRFGRASRSTDGRSWTPRVSCPGICGRRTPVDAAAWIVNWTRSGWCSRWRPDRGIRSYRRVRKGMRPQRASFRSSRKTRALLRTCGNAPMPNMQRLTWKGSRSMQGNCRRIPPRTAHPPPHKFSELLFGATSSE